MIDVWKESLSQSALFSLATFFPCIAIYSSIVTLASAIIQSFVLLRV